MPSMGHSGISAIKWPEGAQIEAVQRATALQGDDKDSVPEGLLYCRYLTGNADVQA